MLSDIRNLGNLNKEQQIEILSDCIDKLKDDDINKTILINKKNSIESIDNSTSYKKKEYQNIYEVNS